MVECHSEASWAILVGAWEIVVLRAAWTVEAQLEKFWRGTVFATVLEIII